jgi:hypothetical protein
LPASNLDSMHGVPINQENDAVFEIFIYVGASKCKESGLATCPVSNINLVGL